MKKFIFCAVSQKGNVQIMFENIPKMTLEKFMQFVKF